MSLLWSRSVDLNLKLKILLPAAMLACMSVTAFAYSPEQFNAVISNEEAQIAKVRDQEITQLKIVLGRRFAESRRPDILLRLAELYVERYRLYFFKENEIHQSLIKQGQKPRYVNHEKSRDSLKSATNACLAILHSRVSFSKMDQVYYFLAYNAEEMGNKKEAVRYFKTIVSNYPRSQYAAEAYRNLAEHSFEAVKYKEAVDYYEKAAQFTKVPSYPRTLYKLAWAYFKVRRKNEALATMKRVIDVAGGNDQFVGLRDEALNDIVMFFSEAGRFSEAHEYFSKVNGGPEIYIRALNRLSSIYDKRGERQLAIKVNNNLVEEYGDKRPDLIHEALSRNVELYQKMGDIAGESAALEKLVQYFSQHAGEIAKGADGEASFTRTKVYLRGRATAVHKDARNEKNPKKKTTLYSRAADLYALYLRAFLAKPSNDKESRERSEIRTYRSDALLAAGRESEAMPELERTLREPGDAKNRREAGASLLDILIKRLDSVLAKNQTSADLEKQFLSVADAFEEAFPSDKLVGELRYKRARLAANHSGPEGLSNDARKALSEMVERFSSRPEAADAAHDLVSDLIKRQKPEEASKLAQTYLGNGSLLRADKKGELEKYLQSVVSHTSFQTVQKIEGDKEFDKAAVEYERLAASAKDPEVARKAWNNAAVNYEKSGRLSDAARIYFQLASKDDLKRLASQQLWSSRFAESAKLYSRLAGMPAYSKDERLSFARTAFALNWGTGDLANGFLIAKQALHDLCDRSSDERCHDIAIDLASLQIEAGRNEEALGHLRSYLAGRSEGLRKAEANFMIAGIYQAMHEDRKASKYFEEAALAVGHKAKPRAGISAARERNFAAHAAFLAVEPYFARFAAIKLELPEAKLKVNTRQKLDQLESLVTRYTGVVGYGDGEWGIAALERLYDAFATFSSELDRAPVPPKFEGQLKEQYLKGIRQVSAPMNDRAMEYLRQGYEKGLQLQVTSSSYVALTQRLSKTLPREYPPAHYAETSLKLVGPVSDESPESLRQSDNKWRAAIAAKLKQNPKAAESWVEFGNLEALSGRLRLARLLYEQSVALNPKGAPALNNLSVVLFMERKPIEATQGFSRAAEVAEFNRDVRLNLARTQLAYHHFRPALENLRPLVARDPKDRDATEALAVALLGTGQFAPAGAKLEELDARGSRKFSLWYNWCVWAGLAGDKGQREDALDRLKSRRSDGAPLEKSQVALIIDVLSKGSAKEKP
jgi:Tfp pilus assembly protein PilF